MQDKNDDIAANSGFKADNFDKEKEQADKMEKQDKPGINNTDKQTEQKILKEQKETD